MRLSPVPALPDDVDVAALAELATHAATAVGRTVAAGRPERVAVHGTKSSSVDVVTAADLAAEDLLREILLGARPHDGVLGEERGLEPGTSGLTWVVDPIDGTVNYLYGLPWYAVSVAVVAGEPDPASWSVLAGAVHRVPDGRAYTAARGRGATLDGRPLRVNPAAPLAQSLVATGFGYRAERRARQGRVVAEVLPLVRDIRRTGSAALDLCALAEGVVDLYYERGLSPWDLAAASLVAAEAGAVVTGLRGVPAGTAMTVAGPDPTVSELAELLAGLGADADD